MLQQDESLLALNVILGVFTVVSFTKLCSDVCRKQSQQQSQEQSTTDLRNELREIRLAMEQMNEQITDIRLCLQEQEQSQEEEQSQEQSQTTQESQTEEEQSQEEQSQEEQSEEEQSQEQEPPPLNVIVNPPTKPKKEKQERQEQKEQSKALVINEIKPVSPKQPDKHTQLIAHLKNNENVAMTYKKQTFTATFIVRSDSQHGYVLKSGTAEYNTPSDFSRAKKMTINDKIKSDNGWDTVTVQRDGNKLTLNELIGQ